MALYIKAIRVQSQNGAQAALPVLKEVMALDPENSALAGSVAALAASGPRW